MTPQSDLNLPPQHGAGVYIIAGYVLPLNFRYAIWDLTADCPVGLYSKSKSAIEFELGLCNAGGASGLG